MVQSKQRKTLRWLGACPDRLLGGAGLLGLIAVVFAAAATTAAALDSLGSREGTEGAPGTVNAATIVLAAPDSLGSPERPPVGFPHDVHVTALDTVVVDTARGCEVCHERDDKRRIVPRFKHVGGVSTMEELVEQYHAGCLGCHEERVAASQKSGPVGCGECHAREPISPPWVTIELDYSLHARHVKALEDRCEACHHVYNEETEKLEPGKGKESSCRDCHGAVDEGKTLSLRNSVHLDCVSCHLERIEKAQAAGTKEPPVGPIDCLGCHDELRQLEIVELDSIPRRQRGQPDHLWLRVPGGTANLVPFDHRHHEEQGRSCATCHHQTMQACSDCHTLNGAVEGGGVTLVQAFHDPNATAACVGCHQQKLMADSKCAGCHELLSGTPGTGSCEICHRGPRLAKDAQIPVQDTEPPTYLTVVAGVAARDMFEPVPAPTVPDTSGDFPDSLGIGVLAKEYQAAPMPHRKIVTAQAKAIGENLLARRFHNPDLEICAGCHHRTPVGDRPPPCVSCHGETAHPTTDQPHLLAAYHRQCITCHQVMKLVTECEKCHKPATEEAQP